MAPAWVTTAEKFASDSSVLIAEVDCTVETDLCSTYGVRGYPTIKYFKQPELEAQDYHGGRSVDDFVKFTTDTLSVPCTPSKKDGCTEKQLEYMPRWNRRAWRSWRRSWRA